MKDRVAGAVSDKHALPFGARTRCPEGPTRSAAEWAHLPGGSEETNARSADRGAPFGLLPYISGSVVLVQQSVARDLYLKEIDRFKKR